MIKYRLLINENVFFRAADCAKELGYVSEEEFLEKNSGICTQDGEFGCLVSESRYNNLCF